jgi:ketosteroid isomerase-like protein
MTEQENTSLVQSLFEAFRAGDIQTILDHTADQVDWNLLLPATIPYAGVRKNRAQIEEFFKAIARTQENRELTVHQYFTQSDVVLALGRYTATVKATGKQIDTPIGLIFTLRDGKILEYTAFSDTAAVAASYATSAAAAAR